MERIVYLVGTSHAYQGGISRENACCNDLIEFSIFLYKICCVYEIKAICEEMHPENLDDKHKGISIPMLVASLLDDVVKHKYCDPSSEQQKIMGIEKCGYFSRIPKLPEISRPKDLKNITQAEADKLERQENLKREPFWLCKIQDLDTWPIIFICGSDHVPTFSNLLRTATFTVIAVNKKWEPREEDRVAKTQGPGLHS